MKDVEILGVGDRFGELVIGVVTPFVFDTTQLPKMFEGLGVHRTPSVIPDGFEWTPEDWEDFVEANFDAIRSQLGNNKMSKDDVYHALIGMPLQDWIAICKEQGWTKRYARKQ